MAETRLSTSAEKFLINHRPTYHEISGNNPDVHGLLMNQRLIQGIFDDKANPARYARFGRMEWDPEQNTRELMAALPDWYRFGLRAFTVGFQGGVPGYDVDNATVDNNPFGEDGKRLDPAYASRMDRLIRAADAVGMIVIVSFLYGAQARRLKEGQAVRNAVITASRFLKEGNYTNVIIEVANEQNVDAFKPHPIVYYPDGAAWLIDLARRESGGLPTGCSSLGNHASREICEASDIVLIHANAASRQAYFNLIEKIKKWVPGKPIVCNEDSTAIGQLKVAFDTHTSWGYMNVPGKQAPPCNWKPDPGEDTFFAHRMAEGLGIKTSPIPFEEQFYLQGLEYNQIDDNHRWIRLACLRPESVDYVEFLRNGKRIYTAYDEPFMLFHKYNYIQDPWEVTPEDREWSAVIHLRNGQKMEKHVKV